MASLIASDQALVERALNVFVTSDAKSVLPFARRLAELVPDPVALFSAAITKVEGRSDSANLNVFRGIISGADDRDPKLARECVRAALRSNKLKPDAISMIGSGKLQADDLKLVVSLLQAGDVEPWQCASLSYGRGLDHLASKEIAPLLDELANHGATGLWTALDIIFMYLYPAKMPDLVLEKKLKTILASPRLFDRVNRQTRDGYHLEQAVGLLVKHGMLDASYVRTLAKRMLSLVKIKQSNIFFEFDGPVRKVLNRLIPKFPGEVWAGVAPVLLLKDSLHRHRVQQLFKPERNDHYGPGPLFELPEQMYLNWVREDPTKRAPTIVQWLPIAKTNADSSLSWHPAIKSFVVEFGTIPFVLGTIASRMHPSGWSGSIVPYIEPWIPLLRAWLDHSLLEVRNWAQERIDKLQKYIEAEKKSDEEDEVRW